MILFFLGFISCSLECFLLIVVLVLPFKNRLYCYYIHLQYYMKSLCSCKQHFGLKCVCLYISTNELKFKTCVSIQKKDV